MSSVKKRYEKLSKARAAYLTRGEQCASVTIPSLLPPEGTKGDEKLHVPHQGLGARGVKSLSAKLVLALLPPRQPFHRLQLDDDEIKDQATVSQLENALMRMEQEIQDDLEGRQLRTALYESLKQLLVVGNVLLYVGPEGIKYHKLPKYVVRRDAFGVNQELILKEDLDKSDVPESIMQLLPENERDADNYEQFTEVMLVGDKVHVTQYIKDHEVPGTRSTYAAAESPWLALRLVKMDGEDYGRSYVEEHLGDLISLENLSRALMEGAQAMARILFLVNPSGTTDEDDLNKAESGDFVAGNLEDIGCLQMNKYADFQVAKAQIDDLKQDLSSAFLLNQAVQRNAERVTAEEIRWMAGELEQALGGVYSLLSVELQVPLVMATIGKLKSEGKLPAIESGKLKPVVLTGVQALGRNQELEKLRQYIDYLAPLGEQALMQALDPSEYAARVATALALDTDNLIPDQEALQQDQQQQQMMAALMPHLPKLLEMAQAQQGQGGGGE